MIASNNAPWPKVSIVMAVYNGEPYVTTAVRSVLDQDFRDFELIVVDDGSTDGTAAIVEGFGDARVVYLRNPQNIGQTSSLNVGIRLSRGAYIARLDADDEYLSGKLTKQVQFLDANPDVTVCGTWAECIDEQGNRSGSFRATTNEKDLRFRLTWTSPLCHVSVLMRRDAVLEVGGYDEVFRYAADYRLWSELAARGYRIVNLPEFLMRYRVFARSFGGATVLGAQGWESARIIADNARHFAQIELSLDEARAIHLRAQPDWGSEEDRLSSYRRLAEIAKGVYGPIPMRVRWDLFASLVWTVSQAPATDARGMPRSLEERLAVLAGRLLKRVSSARRTAVKGIVTRFRPPASR